MLLECFEMECKLRIGIDKDRVRTVRILNLPTDLNLRRLIFSFFCKSNVFFYILLSFIVHPSGTGRDVLIDYFD